MRPLLMVLMLAGAAVRALPAQQVEDEARLVAGALVRLWEGTTTGPGTQMQVVERRGDSLVVKRDALTSNGVMVQRAELRTVAWRTLSRLDVRGDKVKDSPLEGGILGMTIGVVIGSLLGESTASGDIQLDSASDGSLGPLLFGGLGLLIGLGIDAAKDNTPWITLVQNGAP
jgi:hypothetical protein